MSFSASVILEVPVGFMGTSYRYTLSYNVAPSDVHY